MATKPTSPSDPNAFTSVTTEPTTSKPKNGTAAPNKIWSTTPRAISPNPMFVTCLIHPEICSNIKISLFRLIYYKGDRGEITIPPLNFDDYIKLLTRARR